MAKKRKSIKKERKKREARVIITLIILIVSLIGIIYTYNNNVINLYTTQSMEAQNKIEVSVPILQVKMKEWQVNCKANFYNAITPGPGSTYYPVTSQDLFHYLTQYSVIIEIHNKTITVPLTKATKVYISNTVFDSYNGYVIYVLPVGTAESAIILASVTFSSPEPNRINVQISTQAGILKLSFKHYYYLYNDGQFKLKAVRSYIDVPVQYRTFFTNNYQLVDPISGNVITLQSFI